MIFILMTVVLILMVWYGFTSKSRFENKLRYQHSEIEEQKLVIESLRKELENRASRAQFRPHFVFNSLNSIQYLIMKGEKSEAFESLIKFSVLLRRVLEDSERQIISLFDEIEFLQIYLELESLRFDHNFRYFIHCTVEDSKAVFVPPLILQPIVENAIVHGLASKEGERKLEILFRTGQSQLICEINDTGIGREASRKINEGFNFAHKPKGIEHSKQRLNAFNKRIDENAFKIIDLDDANGPIGTSVILTFCI